MNGGRLSNDETFLQGVEELRSQLHATAPDAAAAERALARIGIRYPEETETLTGLWLSSQAEQCEQLLSELVAQHQADAED